MERGIDDCREIKVGGDWLMSSAAMLRAVCMFNIKASVYPFIYRSIPFSECLSHLLRFHFPCGFYRWESFHCSFSPFSSILQRLPFPFAIPSTSYHFYPLLSLSVLRAAIFSTRLWWVTGIRRVTGVSLRVRNLTSEITDLADRLCHPEMDNYKWEKKELQVESDEKQQG